MRHVDAFGAVDSRAGVVAVLAAQDDDKRFVCLAHVPGMLLESGVYGVIERRAGELAVAIAKNDDNHPRRNAHDVVNERRQLFEAGGFAVSPRFDKVEDIGGNRRDATDLPDLQRIFSRAHVPVKRPDAKVIAVLEPLGQGKGKKLFNAFYLSGHAFFHGGRSVKNEQDARFHAGRRGQLRAQVWNRNHSSQ